MRACQRAVTSAEYARWRAYDRISPIGPERGDLQAAIVAAAVFNARRRKSSDRYVQPETFMPKFYRPVRRLPPRAMFDAIRQMNDMFGGDFVEKDA